MIGSQHIHHITDIFVDIDTLWTKFKENENICVFLSLCQLPSDYNHRENIIGTALAAGVPFMFWPLSGQWDCESLHKEFNDGLFSCDKSHWPGKVHQQRKVQPDWNYCAMLWDDLSIQPPDVNNPLQAAVE